MIKQTRVENGMLRGIPGADPRVYVYRGVPYAAPPVGELRWHSPMPADDWVGVRDCARFVACGRWSTARYSYTAAQLREWGYANLVNSYYRFKNGETGKRV